MRKNIFGIANLLLTIILFSNIPQVYSIFTGQITLSNSKVQQTNVDYTFTLSFQTQIPSTGNLVVRFPSDYAFTSTSSISCQGISGFTSNTLSCALNYQARTVTIMNGFKTTLNDIKFTLSGVTNPAYAVQTGLFTLNSYSYDSTSGSYTLLESSGDLFVTPTPGSLSNCLLTPFESIVGITTKFNVQFTLEHYLPSNGQISILMPKWNSFAPQLSEIESLVSISTSPGQIGCSPISGFTAASLTCIYNQGSSSDTIHISMSSDATQITAGSTIQIQFTNFKTPPSLQPLTGFMIYTTSQNSNTIDQSSSLAYSVSTASQIPSNYVVLSSSDNKINAQSTFVIRFQNQNPLPAQSKIRIKIPSDFGVSMLTSITGSGSREQANPAFTLSNSNYQVDINGFNDQYLEPQVNIYVNMNTIQMPKSSKQTQSFEITLLNNAGYEIEKVTTGVTFKAIPAQITIASIYPKNDYINYQGTEYSFKFTPTSSFLKSAMIKVTFPSQIYINNRNNVKLVYHNNIVSNNAIVTVTSNKYALITNVFQNDYSLTQGEIQIIIDGITNPDSTFPTDSFKIEILYTDNTDIINIIDSGLTIKCQASSNTDLIVTPNPMDTGSKTTLNFQINTYSQKVLKGSYIKIQIPKQFEIYDNQFSVLTCSSIYGFSDEISCSLNTENSGVHTLTVTNGFNSKDFNGGLLKFSINEIRNPKSTQTTDSFQFQIYDSNNQVQYTYNNGYTVSVQPAQFSFAMITSNNPYNGGSSIYTFTITLSVDTPIGSQIMIDIPKDIEVDNQKDFYCKQLTHPAFSCYRSTDITFLIQIATEERNQQFLANGTSISFELGYLINPISLKQSESFILSTFIEAGFNKYYINKENSSLTIQNTQKGNIYNLNINQEGNQELSAETGIRLTFSTQIQIPQNSLILLTLPSNIQVNAKTIEASINGKNGPVNYDSNARQIKMQVQEDGLNWLNAYITKGLFNPHQGPYSYSNFIVEIVSKEGYSIVQQITNQTWITVNCTNFCNSCNNKLQQCTSCSYNSVLLTSFYYFNSSCLQNCPAGFFGDSDYLCKKCESPCLECKFGSQLCTKCDPNQNKPYTYPQTYSCHSTCPAGTYLDQSQNLCVKCQSPCYTCLSNDECLSCDRLEKTNNKINFYPLQNKCYDSCPEGTVVTSGNQCVDCNSPCKTCSEQPDQCTSCLDSYFFHNNLCIETCPSQYVENREKMICEFQGEMILPVPFSILAGVISLGLIIARFMQHNTRFCVTVLAFIDPVLKANLIVLLIFLYREGHFVSSIIISCSLFLSFVINFLIWRTFYYKYQMEQDVYFQMYIKKFRKLSKTLKFLSFIISIHLFSLTYSRFLGKKAFSGSFKDYPKIFQLIGRLTILSMIFVYLPAVFACCQNLFFVKVAGQLFYLDLDSLILVVYLCIIIIIGLTQKERERGMIPGQLNLKDLIKAMTGAVKEVPQSEDFSNLMNKMKRSSFDLNSRRGASRESAITIQSKLLSQQPIDENNALRSKNAKLIQREYQSSVYSTNSNKLKQKYFSLTPEIKDEQIIQSTKDKLQRYDLQFKNAKALKEQEQQLNQGIQSEYQRTLNENDYLLQQEQQLRREIDELRQTLQDYQEMVQNELQESEQLHEIKELPKTKKKRKNQKKIKNSQSRSPQRAKPPISNQTSINNLMYSNKSPKRTMEQVKTQQKIDKPKSQNVPITLINEKIMMIDQNTPMQSEAINFHQKLNSSPEEQAFEEGKVEIQTEGITGYDSPIMQRQRSFINNDISGIIASRNQLWLGEKSQKTQDSNLVKLEKNIDDSQDNQKHQNKDELLIHEMFS